MLFRSQEGKRGKRENLVAGRTKKEKAQGVTSKLNGRYSNNLRQ